MKDIYWETVKTKHNYAADEVISALQKTIRRGDEQSAVFFAYELMTTSEKMANKFWQRLRVISAEDIGLSNPQLASIIYSLHENFIYLRKQDDSPWPGKGDKFLQGILATLLLVRSAKSRYVDELWNNLRDKIEKENYRVKIPRYAYDMHTKKGKLEKKDRLNFWLDGALLKNDFSRKEKKHLKELVARLKKEKVR